MFSVLADNPIQCNSPYRPFIKMSAQPRVVFNVNKSFRHWADACKGINRLFPEQFICGHLLDDTRLFCPAPFLYRQSVPLPVLQNVTLLNRKRSLTLLSIAIQYNSLQVFGRKELSFYFSTHELLYPYPWN